MTLVLLGVDYQSADLAIREQWSLSPEDCQNLLFLLGQLEFVTETVVVSTCNRTEVYALTDSILALQQWILSYYKLTWDWFEHHGYVKSEQAVVTHLMSVACGLNSLVLGEHEILGQLKKSYSLALGAKTVHKYLARLFENSFAIAKQVRHQTDIGEQALSIAYLAANLPKHIFADLSRCRVCLIGAGATNALVMKYLYKNGVQQYWILNRTRSTAIALAQHIPAKVTDLTALQEALEYADIIITATNSKIPLVTQTDLKAVRRYKLTPQLLIDLAVPRNIEPNSQDLKDIYLYTIDDLKKIAADTLKLRLSSVQQAEILIEQAVTHFWHWQAIDTLAIKEFRETCEQCREAELNIALAQIKRGISPETVLKTLAHRLTNKLIHMPTVELRHAVTPEYGMSPPHHLKK